MRPASPNSWTANATRPGRHEDQDDPGDREEAAQVDPDAGREDRVPDRDRDGETGERREEGRDGGSARGADREEEEDGLEALAGDRDEGEPGEGGRRPGGEREIDPCSSSPFIARPWRRIQNSIQVRTITARTAARPSMLSCTTSGRRPTVSDDERADDDREHQRCPDADPDAAQGVAAIELDEVGGDDARR